jgi:hypothetical protein
MASAANTREKPVACMSKRSRSRTSEASITKPSRNRIAQTDATP